MLLFVYLFILFDYLFVKLPSSSPSSLLLLYVFILSENKKQTAVTNITKQRMKGHRIKWDHFNILATGRSDVHCKVKETLLIRDLQPALNENVGSEKLLLY